GAAERNRKEKNEQRPLSASMLLCVLLTSLPPPSGQLAAGTCEIVTLDRDSSQPRRTIARQTARCACRRGQIAGTTRARPACVDAAVVRSRQWCDMSPCLDDEGCDLLVNQSGWTCTQPGGRVKTTTHADWSKHFMISGVTCFRMQL
uniref:TAFA chemokine like family member 5 n=1 Tax=Myripristis murdjan TaxID=586833 RepID=A0A667ZCI6_9TELE